MVTVESDAVVDNGDAKTAPMIRHLLQEMSFSSTPSVDSASTSTSATTSWLSSSSSSQESLSNNDSSLMLLVSLLPPDCWAHVLVHLDFWLAEQVVHVQQHSALMTTQHDKKIQKDQLCHVWKAMFERNLFSAEDLPRCDENSLDHLVGCRQRRRLLYNLLQPSGSQKKRKHHPFNLPHRYFSFLPLLKTVPTSWRNHVEDNRAATAMDFDCDCFMLTSTGTDPELLLLNPATQTLLVHKNLLVPSSNKSPSSQLLLETAQDSGNKQLRAADYFEVVSAPPAAEEEFGRQRPDLTDEDEHELDVVYLGTESKPILAAARNASTTVTGHMVAVGRSLSTTARTARLVAHHRGTFSRCIELLAWFRNNQSKEDNPHTNSSEYSDQHVCRLRSGFFAIDVCSVTRQVYVNYGNHHATTTMPPPPAPPAQLHQRPAAAAAGGARQQPRTAERDDNDDHEEEEDQDLLHLNRNAGQPYIVVYPMVPYSDQFEPHHSPDKYESRETDIVPDQQQQRRLQREKYFPNPLFWIPCRHRVTAFAVGPTGDDLVVGTVQRGLELWKLPVESSSICMKHSQQQQPELLQSIRVSSAVKLAYQSFSSLRNDRDQKVMNSEKESPTVTSPSESTYPDSTTNQDDGSSAEQLPAAIRAAISSNVTSICMSRHVQIAVCGFFALQHSRSNGSTLLFWKKRQEEQDVDNINEEFQLQSVIHLPLSSSRPLKLHYDGRRLIVLGQDHIGMIILVYHVLNTLEDADTFHCPRQSNGCDDWDEHDDDHSGGVWNLTQPRRVKFANRIRHAALGGLEYFDVVHMTCNERFIIVNTKAGNLLDSSLDNVENSGSHSYTDGLLVIDLLDDRENDLA